MAVPSEALSSDPKPGKIRRSSSMVLVSHVRLKNKELSTQKTAKKSHFLPKKLLAKAAVLLDKTRSLCRKLPLGPPC